MSRLRVAGLISILLLTGIILSGVGYAELLIDEFDRSTNFLGGRSSVYQQEPSRALAIESPSEFYGSGGQSLMIKYDKKGQGGPYGAGGWCGWYTLLKKGEAYFDATSYKTLTFYVKGANGNENFKVGMADRHWDRVGDSVKSEEIGKYLSAGNITTEWQKAAIPLDAFFIDFKELASVAICFEGDCFPDGVGKGTIYIDQLKLE